MKATDSQIETMLVVDRINLCGPKAREDFKRLCLDRGLKHFPTSFASQYTKKHKEIANEVLALWRTTKKFKVRDKVYVVPLTMNSVGMDYCIRAVVTEVDEKHGYFLRAFEKDLPGIHMFNIWDKDLELRTSKARKPIPEGLTY